MSYWDASALLHIVVTQPGSGQVRALAAEERDPATSWLTPVECWSAIARLGREDVLVPAEAAHVRRALADLLGDFEEIAMATPVRRQAENVLRRHALRAGDALHLAAALVWAEDRPQGRAFICLDTRLRQAALVEGFTILPADLESFAVPEP